MRDYFLTTARTGFSHWREDDLPLAGLLWGETDVTRYICASGVFTPREIKDRLTLELQNQTRYGVQYWPVFDLVSGDLIGCCGLRPCAGERDAMELGTHLRKKYWRQGFAFETAEAVIRYAFTDLNVRELRAGHHPKNDGSRKLLEKLGFSYVEDCLYAPTGLYHPSYRLVRPEKQIKLILPEKKYFDSYADAAREYRADGITTYEFLNLNRYDLFQHMERYRAGKNLPENRVPATYLWLVDGTEFIGEVSIRHCLTDTLLRYGGHIGYGIRHSQWHRGNGTAMLAMALPYAKRKLGLNRVLITCDDDNTASARVIEKNGGILRDRIFNSVDGKRVVTRRYWIDLT